VLYNLGKVHRLQAKYDEAITYYKESLRLKPNQPVAHKELAMVLFRQGTIALIFSTLYRLLMRQRADSVKRLKPPPKQ
jgi:tetratricopeptide (TPR) repeat protein